MALLQETAVSLPAALLVQVTGGTLKNCENADFSVCGFSTDTRTITPGNCFIALKGENFNGNLYAKQAAEKGAVLCILSEEPAELPGVPYILVADTVQAYGKIANACLRERKAAGLRVIGVTGSSGKTTVKDMTAHVLAAKYRTYATSGNHNNHIGVPFTLLHMPADTEVAVIEMGMNHTGEISYLTKIAEPDLGIITNIGTAHIGNLGSQENIFRAKMEITDGMDLQTGRLVFSADDPYLAGCAQDARVSGCVRYSTRQGAALAELSAADIVETADATRFLLEYQGERAQAVLPMTGLHNVTDALLAVHTGLLCGMTLAECAAALADFIPGALRSERVQIGKCTVIRDYYNANPEAMAASLQMLGIIAGDAPKLAVLGNMNELGEFAADAHKKLGELCRARADAAFFCGENYRDFAAGYGAGAQAYAQQSELIEALKNALPAYENNAYFMLIKASRGLHMENVFGQIFGQ